MLVRAKFKVDAVRCSMYQRYEKQPDGKEVLVPVKMQTIEMSPVYGNGDPQHENTQFWHASPSGKLELGCINEEAGRYFELGKEYYLDFQKAD